MKNSYPLISAVFIMCTLQIAQAQPANDDCLTATTLIANAACVSGSTKSGLQYATIEAGEVTQPSCWSGTGANQSVWYKFTATATVMYYQATTSSGLSSAECDRWAMVVYNTDVCIPSSSKIIACETANTQGNADQIIAGVVDGLTIGNTYLLQVLYRKTSSVNKFVNFCINVGDNFSDCATCSDPCGQGCGFSTWPTIPQLAACPVEFDEHPYLEGNEIDTFCFTLVAQSSDIDIQVANSGTCNGYVAYLGWDCYDYSCNYFQSGSYPDMTISGLTPGSSYTVCYKVQVLSDCYYVWWKPYFVGAYALPIELTSFDVQYDNSQEVTATWQTASELNNDYFLVERSADGINFSAIGTVEGAGTSEVPRNYSFTDENPLPGTAYYRLTHVDYNGGSGTSQVVSVTTPTDVTISVADNVITVAAPEVVTAQVINITGQVISMQQGMEIQMPLNGMPNGNYLVRVASQNETRVARISKTDDGLLGSAGVLQAKVNAPGDLAINPSSDNIPKMSLTLHL